MAEPNKVDELTGVETTGHEWDGISELNNPLPRWWLWTFYATILFAIVYTILFPAWPGITGHSQGLLGWSSRAAIREDMEAAEARHAAQRQQIAAAQTMDEIIADPQLLTFASASGASLFKTNCSTCHGSGAQGSPGYPNLNDDSWIWGGTPEDIALTIRHGVRDDIDPDTRLTEMPAFGRDELLEPAQIADVVQFVLQVSGQPHDAAMASAGATIFTDNCAACHGENAEGIAEFGGPQLNDALWLYGGSAEAITAQVTLPRHGRMPAWEQRLGDVGVKELAVYVHQLGGGE